VVPLSGCHASLVISVIVSPFPSKHNKWNSHEHLFSASFLLLTLFINSSNAIVGFVGIFISTSFFFWQLQLDSTIELFVCGHVSFCFLFLSGITIFTDWIIGLLDSWIYLSAACLLDYNPTEVSVSYACPFDGVWKSAGEYLALTGSRLDGAEMLACGLATHFVPLEVFTHLRCLIE
jgi:hypothetical protein